MNTNPQIPPPQPFHTSGERVPRILITGCGLVGPCGVGEAALAKVLSAGSSCFGDCTLFTTPLQVAQVRDFNLATYVKNPRAERSPRISQYALAAAALAFKQSKLDPKQIGSERTAIAYGTGFGPSVATEQLLRAIVTQGLDKVDPVAFQESVFNAPASLICIHFGIKGPSVVLPMGWTAGLYALKQGCDLLRRNLAQQVLVVAAEELTGSTHEGLRRLGFVTPNNDKMEMTNPFDPQVNGANIGEGAVALVLELETTVAARNGTGRACVAACITGGDALGVGKPDTSGAALARVMQQTLTRAGKTAANIDHVWAGTLVNKSSDLAELNGLLQLFNERSNPCPITSLKANIGDTLGPSSLFSVVAGILELENSLIYGTPNLVRNGVGCIIFPQQTMSAQVQTVLINAVGISGTYASALLEAI